MVGRIGLKGSKERGSDHGPKVLSPNKVNLSMRHHSLENQTVAWWVKDQNGQCVVNWNLQNCEPKKPFPLCTSIITGTVYSSKHLIKSKE